MFAVVLGSTIGVSVGCITMLPRPSRTYGAAKADPAIARPATMFEKRMFTGTANRQVLPQLTITDTIGFSTPV